MAITWSIIKRELLAYFSTPLAYVFIIIWPVAVPLVYAMLLWVSRDAIREGVPTSLSGATLFLYADWQEHILVGADRDVPQIGSEYCRLDSNTTGATTVAHLTSSD